MAEDPELEDLLSSVEAGATQTKKDDAELSSLLDNALKDFGPFQSAKSEDGATEAAETAADGDANSAKFAASENGFPNLQELLQGELDSSLNTKKNLLSSTK